MSSYVPKIQFNDRSKYRINASGDRLAAIPYQKGKANDESFQLQQQYRNKFVNRKVKGFSEEPIIIEPDNLEKILQKSQDTKESVDDVFTEEEITYVQVDSRQRRRYPENIYQDTDYPLPPYPLQFTDGSNKVIIHLPDHPLRVNDQIVLNNIVSKTLFLKNVLSVKKNSYYVKIHQQNHGLSLYGLYDATNSNEFQAIEYVHNLPYGFTPEQNIPDGIYQSYILKKNLTQDFFITLGSVQGSNVARDMIGNIPTNYLNKKHRALLVFTKNGTDYEANPNYYLIQLLQPSSINYQDGISQLDGTTTIATNRSMISYLMLYGVPLNYLNTGVPINQNRLYPYLNVTDVSKDTFVVEINYNAVVDPAQPFYSVTDLIHGVQLIDSNRGGGENCFLKIVKDIVPGYPNPNQYVFVLDREYKNITEVKIVASAFPNSQRVIHHQMDRLYWRNLNDGNQIYYLSIPAGNYSPRALERELDRLFGATIRYQYTTQYQNGITQKVVVESTPVNTLLYDDDGYYKYHIVSTVIDAKTDQVSFSSFRQLLEQDTLDGLRIINIPDNVLQVTQGTNLSLPFPAALFPTIHMIPFDPTTEKLYMYFTVNCQQLINQSYPYAFGHLYQFLSYQTGAETPGYNTWLAKYSDTALLTNFYRNKGVYGGPVVSTQELTSVNTNTLLQNFTYNYLSNEVYFPNHQLHVGDMLITDQFINPLTDTQIFVYSITKITSNDRFTVQRYDHGAGIKFIYDGLIINFTAPASAVPPHQLEAYQYLDQTLATPVVPNTTLSLTAVQATGENQNTAIIYQPHHQLAVGDTIVISSSTDINYVPASTINGMHTITSIINADHYEITFGTYTPLAIPADQTILNRVTITYPDLFQMFFNYQDTIGNLLSFKKVGQGNAITPYRHVITNQTPYEEDYDYQSLGKDYNEVLKKLNMTGEPYFYISSPELGTFQNGVQNTAPVNNVFSIIRWFDYPGYMIYDSFAPVTTVFDVPLSTLTQIGLTMQNPDGTLVDFNGLDHSFVLQITEIYNVSDNTNISARTNAEFVFRRV